ncbi:MAG: TIGR03790 family protein [Opitutales bacterium]
MCFALAALLVRPAAASGEAESVVIVVNANDPDSLAIGSYYSQQRGIPEENIVALDAPTEETISLRTYVDQIHNPLLNKLMERGWITGVKQAGKDRYGRERLIAVVHKIGYLVTVRGIPLRFKNDPELLEDAPGKLPASLQHNRAAVDSELALLAAPPDLSMTAFIPNPYFEQSDVAASDAQRVIKVSRLDGPAKADVIHLIDRTLKAEETGLMGRAYIDSGGPHKKGDVWFEAARDLAEAAYFETDFEGSKRMIGFSDRLDAPAIYMGWYRRHAYGPWETPGWSVPPGAIGFHLHSFSATTVRSTGSGWLGPFVRQGYCAMVGNVFEPYLEYTHRPQVFLKHLLAGGNFGDAVFKANPALSWQTLALGDPLYRPFKVGLEEQIAAAEKGPWSSYIDLREIQRSLAEEGTASALELARSRFASAPTLPLAYRLSKLLEREGQTDAVAQVLHFTRYLNVFAVDELALAQHIANQLHRFGDSKLALDLYRKMLAEDNLPKDLREAVLNGAASTAREAGEDRLAEEWNLQHENP